MHLQRAELGREALCPMHPSSIHGVEDMSTLAELHEAAIMHNLFLRYHKDNIYVSCILAEIAIVLQTGQTNSFVFFSNFLCFHALDNIYHVCIYRCDTHLLSLVFL